MAAYTFGTVAVYDPITDLVVENATGGHLVATVGGTAIPIYDLNDSPITQITSNRSGQSIPFKADVLSGLVQFGSVAVTVWANEVGALVANAASAAASAASALTAANAAAAAAAASQATVAALLAGGGTNLINYSQVNTLPGYPTSFPVDPASGVVLAATAQNVLGVKTFATAPAIPDGSYALAKIIGLVLALAGKVTLPTLTANMGFLLTIEESGGVYDPIPSNLPLGMRIAWVGVDDPTLSRSSDWRVRLP